MEKLHVVGIVSGVALTCATAYWLFTNTHPSMVSAAPSSSSSVLNAASQKVEPGEGKAMSSTAVDVRRQDLDTKPDALPDYRQGFHDAEGLAVGNNADYPTLGYRMAEMQARRPGKVFDHQQVMFAVQMPAAWQADDRIADQLNLSDEDRYDGRSFVRFEPIKIETLVPGDEMDIPIPQLNRDFVMRVERVEVYDDGAVTWYGHLKDFTEFNQVSITQAEGVTQIGVFMPDAHYAVEAFGDAGWVVDGSTLFKGDDIAIEVVDGIERMSVVHSHHGRQETVLHDGHGRHGHASGHDHHH